MAALAWRTKCVSGNDFNDQLMDHHSLRRNLVDLDRASVSEEGPLDWCYSKPHARLSLFEENDYRVIYPPLGWNEKG